MRKGVINIYMTKILVTGGSGLVGYGIQKIKHNSNHEFIFLRSKDCDLTNYNETKTFFEL